MRVIELYNGDRSIEIDAVTLSVLLAKAENDTRNLLQECSIEGNPDFLARLAGEIVVARDIIDFVNEE